MGHWDIPERPLEPPEEKSVVYCGYCGDEIYDGDIVYRIDGQPIHKDCLEAFSRDCFGTCKEVIDPEILVRAYW